MLEGAKEKIEGQIRQAQSRIKGEMVDTAIDLAIRRLGEEITAEDNQRLLEQYLEAAGKS